MNPWELPRCGPILNATKDYVRLNRRLASISGKRVLCIGYSEAEIDEYIAPEDPAEIVALTLWENHADAQVRKFSLVIGDITKRTDFPPGHFDAVMTLSVFEHVNPLKSAIDELHRILKPGGYLFVLFGPAWSSPYGHHIYHRAGDRLLDFCRWETPAHIHLLCSPAEILRFYTENGYDASDGQAALHWFFETEHINRAMYEDYIDLLSCRFQFVFSESMFTPLPLSHINLLRSRFSRYRDFTTYGAKFILQALHE